MGDLQKIGLFDFSGGLVNRRTNPLDYPNNAIWDGNNVDVSDMSLKTRKGMSKLTATPVLADGVVQRIFQVRFPVAGKSYLIAQAVSSADNKLYVSATDLPSTSLSFEEIYNLGLGSGEISVSAFNDRAIITEGVINPPLVFLGGLSNSGADWASCKQIFGSLNGVDFFDMTADLCDADATTYVNLPGIPAAGGIYLCFDVPLTSGVYAGIHNAASDTSTLIVERYINGSWTAISATDNTADGGVAFAKSGTITWSAVATDYQCIAGVSGFWIRLRFSVQTSASEVDTKLISGSDVFTQTDYKGTIAKWNQSATVYGRFETSGDVAVAIGAGTDICLGSLVTFSDAATATIVAITDDGTGTSGVTLSAAHVDGNVSKITRAIVTQSGSEYRLSPNYFRGENGSQNPGTDYSTSLMTSPNTPSPAAITTSNEVIYAGWKAFDQISDYNGWVSTEDTGWIKIDLGSAIIINKYMLQARNIIGGTGFPSAWTLDGSNDDSVWTTVDGHTGVADPGTAAWNTYTFTNSVAYRYYRIVVTTHNAGALAIGEIRFIAGHNVMPSQMAVGVTTANKYIDVTDMDNISAVLVNCTLPSGSKIYHAISWDARNTWYVFLNSSWRIIAQKDVTGWKYASGSAMVIATSMLEALRLAFGKVENQWDKTAIEAMGLTQWMSDGGFSPNYVTMDFAFGMLSGNAATPELTGYEIQGAGYVAYPWLITSASQLDKLPVTNNITFWKKSPIIYEAFTGWGTSYSIKKVYLTDSRANKGIFQLGAAYSISDIVLIRGCHFLMRYEYYVPVPTPENHLTWGGGPFYPEINGPKDGKSYFPFQCIYSAGGGMALFDNAITGSFEGNYGDLGIDIRTMVGYNPGNTDWRSYYFYRYMYDHEFHGMIPPGTWSATLQWASLFPDTLVLELSGYPNVIPGQDFRIYKIRRDRYQPDGTILKAYFIAQGVTATGSQASTLYIATDSTIGEEALMSPTQPRYGDMLYGGTDKADIFYFDEATVRFKSDTGTRIKPGTQFSGCFMGTEHHFTAVPITSEQKVGAHWTTDTVMQVGDIRIPVTANGYRYEVTSRAGDFKTDPTTEPTWPTTLGTTVVDDQVTWTCRGGTKTGFPYTGHGLVAGDQVYLYNFAGDYNRVYTVDADTSVDKIIISATYVTETMTTACAWRKIITVGQGYEAHYVSTGCLVSFQDATQSVLSAISGDGSDLDTGILLDNTEATGDVTSIDTVEYYSGRVRPVTKQVLLPAAVDGKDNSNTQYANPAMTSWNSPNGYVCAKGVNAGGDYYNGTHPERCFDHDIVGSSQGLKLAVADWNRGYIAITFPQPVCINKYDIHIGPMGHDYNMVTDWKVYGYDAKLTSATLTDLPAGTLTLDEHTGYAYKTGIGEAPTTAYWLGADHTQGGYFTFENGDSFYTYIIEFIATTNDHNVAVSEIKLVSSSETMITFTPIGTCGTLAGVTKQIDSSTWSAINSAVVISDAQKLCKVAFAFSFDNQATFKCYRGGWRTIVRENLGTWQYNSGIGIPAWSNSEVNTLKGALLQALTNTYNYTEVSSLQNMDASNWQEEGGFSVSVNTIDVMLVFTTDMPYSPSFTKLVFNVGTTTSKTLAFDNDSTDISQADIKGTIANWATQNNDRTRGYFTTSTGVGVTLGSGNINTDVEIGDTVYFTDGTSAIIVQIIGAGGTDGSVILSDQVLPVGVASIKRIFYASSALTISHYSNYDGSTNSTVFPATPAMTSANTPSPYVISESSYSVFPAYKAWNQASTDATDCWKTSPGITAASIIYDYGSGVAKVINKYAVKSVNDATAISFPKAWTLYGSKDATTWVSLDSQSVITWPGSNTWTGYFTFSNIDSYRYYKLDFTASNGQYLEMGEIKLVEAQAIVCADYAYVQCPSSLEITPTSHYLPTAISFLSSKPGVTEADCVISFNGGTVWKVYSNGWRSVIQYSGGHWQYNSNLTTPVWSNAPTNSFVNALEHSFTNTLAEITLLTATHYDTIGGFEADDTIDIAYKLKASGSDIPYVSGVTCNATRPAGFIDAAVNRISYRAPCQLLQNISDQGQADLTVGVIKYTSGSGAISDYSVACSDFVDTTGASLKGFGIADFLYIGGVWEFYAAHVTVANNLYNIADSITGGQYWDGTVWKPLTLVDGTASDGHAFARNGDITWAIVHDWRMNSPIPGATVMGYWIRLSVSASLTGTTADDKTENDILVSNITYTVHPKALPKYKYVANFENRLVLANRPDNKCQADFSRKFEEYGFSGSNTLSLLAGGEDEIIGLVKTHQQLWLSKLEDWYMINADTISSGGTPRAEVVAQVPINPQSVVCAPLDKWGRKTIPLTTDSSAKYGIYFLNHAGAWCFIGSDLLRLGEWVNWWDTSIPGLHFDFDNLHKATGAFWAYRNWIIWSVPMISTLGGSPQTTCNKILIYDITQGMWQAPQALAFAHLQQARTYQNQAPGEVGENILLAGGYDGHVYKILDVNTTTDAGADIPVSVETGWLNFGSPYTEKIIRSLYIFGTIESGDLTFEVRVDGEESTDRLNSFVISSLALGSSDAYVLDFSHRDVMGRSFKFILSWTGPGDIFGIDTEIGPVRDWPST